MKRSKQEIELHGLAKAFKATRDRRTRFHTPQGDLMPASAWPDLVVSLARRLAKAPRRGPWMVPSAVRELDRLMRSDWAVLELGSGASTVWYARRAGDVTSLEDEERWYGTVKFDLELAGLSKCELRLLPLEEFPDVVESFPDETFDLVVVDCNDSRVRLACAEAAKTKVKRGGILVVDDTDDPRHRQAFSIFGGWSVRQFVGVKHHPLMAVETTLFIR